MDTAAATRVGAGMLGEIEEASLDEILASLRASLATPTTTSIGGNASDVNIGNPNSHRIKEYPFPPLNDLVQRHFRATQSAPLAVSGRHLPLLYALIATLIAAPHNKAVLVVDMDGRFDVSRILDYKPFPPNPAPQATAADPPPPSALRPSDLNHVHVTRPARGGRIHTAEAVASAQHFMLYAAHGSRSREWWGTLVVGGGLNPSSSTSASGQPVVDVTAAWKGWLRVDRAEVRGFGVGVSVEEALAARGARGGAVDAADWVASSVWGEFGFGGQE